MSLFDRLGGEAAISAVVDQFYSYMLQDPRVSHFYQSIDIPKLKCRQKQFITLVTGGPNNYQGTDMKQAHCKLSITAEDFEVTWENLQKSLEHFNVQKSLILELKQIFYSVQAQIVTKIKEATPNAEFHPQDSNKFGSSKCPYSGKSQLLKQSQGVENCPSKLKNNPYMKHHY